MKRTYTKGEILQAKAFPVVDLIQSRGIEVKKQGSNFLCLCPFHSDTNPSLSINPEKNLFNCFGCGTGGDAIEFFMKFDRVSFGEAVGVLIGDKKDESFSLNRIADFYHSTFNNSPEAKTYLQSRGITDESVYSQFMIGYADGSIFSRFDIDDLKSADLVNKNNREHFKGCVVFPLIDDSGNVVDFYGRRLEDKKGLAKHLYLKGTHRGIFNIDALKEHDTIILTESIIDSLTLIQHGFKNTVPLYGTNGLTPDHLAMFAKHGIKHILLCLDADDGGRKAAVKFSDQLRKACTEQGRSEGFSVDLINLPDGHDPNSYFGIYTAEDFRGLLPAPTTPSPLLGQERVLENEGTEPKPDELNLTLNNRQYRIKGIPSSELLNRLRVTVRFEYSKRTHIDTIDLYLSKSRLEFANNIEKIYSIPKLTIEADLLTIIDAIEKRQAKYAESNQTDDKTMSPSEEGEALKSLTNPKLMDEILADLETLGYVGEETNKLLLYLIATSHKLSKPMSAIIVSQSGAGKSGLVEKVQELMPPEDVVYLSRISQCALFYMPEHSLQNKLLVIEERNGSESADYALRGLQSKDIVVQAVTIKNPLTGNFESRIKQVNGPASVLETTTNPDINFENDTRCFIIYLDESAEQTEKIHRNQQESHGLNGLFYDKSKDHIRNKHHNIQRLLKPIKIVNPYSHLIEFPRSWLRTRRDYPRFLTLIDTLAFLHQYQREVKTINHPDYGTIQYIETNLDDYRIAYNLTVSTLGDALSDLKKPAIELLKKIVAMVNSSPFALGHGANDPAQLSRSSKSPSPLQGEGRGEGLKEDVPVFTRRQIREYTGLPNHHLKKYLPQLEDMEYLEIVKKGQCNSYEYKLNNIDFDFSAKLDGLLKPEELEKKLEPAPQLSCRSGRGGRAVVAGNRDRL